jgi:hypothetical protein
MKFPPWLISARKSVEHMWILFSQPNFLDIHESGIEPLTTCLKEPTLLPLRSIYYWFIKVKLYIITYKHIYTTYESSNSNSDKFNLHSIDWNKWINSKQYYILSPSLFIRAGLTKKIVPFYKSISNSDTTLDIIYY